MNIEEIARTGLEDLAAAVQPSAPDPAVVRRSVHRANRLRAGMAIGLAAAVTAAVLVGAGQLRGGDSGPQPAGHSPKGDAVIEISPDAVWAQQGTIFDGGTPHRIDGTLTSTLAPTSGGVAYGIDNGDIVYQPTNGATAVIGHDAPLGPAGDATSGLVAWFEGTGLATKLVVYDVDAGREVVRADVRDLTIAASESIVGFNQPPITWLGYNERHGVTAFFAADGRTWRYDSDVSGRRQLEQVGTQGIDTSLDLTAWLEPGSSTMDFVRAGGAVASSYRPLESDGGLSHDGRFYAGYSRGELVLVDTATGQAVNAVLPQGVVPFSVTWSRNVVMFVGPNTGRVTKDAVYACPVDTFRCQVVDDSPTFYKAVLPAS